ncbi:MAG TPA: HEAT repeat domain-containing protein [Elusimicrobiales bacterium]|nr:HEAT repeat domain-containing protein [Elusimicrobiales bacterium]
MKWILLLLIFIGGIYYLVRQDRQEKVLVQQAEQLKKDQASETLPIKTEKQVNLRFSADTVQTLRGLTQDANEKVRFAAAELLWQLQDEQAPSVIKKMLQEETDPATRQALIALLSAEKTKISLALLAEALNDYDKETRLKAVDAIGGFTSKEALPVLGKALKDYDEDVKLKALEAINKVRKDLETQKAQQLQQLEPDPLFKTNP